MERSDAERVEGERVTLRPVTGADLALMVSWRNASRGAFCDDRPIGLEQQRRWYDAYLTTTDRCFVIESPQGTPCGMACLYDIDEARGTAEFGRLVIDAASRGQGIAADACSALLRFAADTLRLRSVYLHVLADNGTARSLYERLGFRREPSGDSVVKRPDGRESELLSMTIDLTRPRRSEGVREKP